jgi:hypothetical protein
MTATRGAEESTEWRQPVDFIALCDQAADELAELLAANRGGRTWSDLLDTFDRQRQVGQPAEALIATLALAVLREDNGFYAYQMLEAGVHMG